MPVLAYSGATYLPEEEKVRELLATHHEIYLLGRNEAIAKKELQTQMCP